MNPTLYSYRQTCKCSPAPENHTRALPALTSTEIKIVQVTKQLCCCTAGTDPDHSPPLGCLVWETVTEQTQHRGKSCLHPPNAATLSALWSHPDRSNSTSLLVLKKQYTGKLGVCASPCGKLAAMPHCRASSPISTSAPAHQGSFQPALEKHTEKNRAFQNHYHKNEICFFPSSSLKQQVSNPGQAPVSMWCIKWTDRERKQPQCLWLTAGPTLLSQSPTELVLTVLSSTTLLMRTIINKHFLPWSEARLVQELLCSFSFPSTGELHGYWPQTHRCVTTPRLPGQPRSLLVPYV